MDYFVIEIRFNIENIFGNYRHCAANLTLYLYLVIFDFIIVQTLNYKIDDDEMMMSQFAIALLIPLSVIWFLRVTL